MAAREKHRKKFQRWQERASEKTRHLSQLIEAHIVPPLLEAGFAWVDVALQQPDWPVNAHEIRLERVGNSVVDSVDITFGKYGDPKFQIGFSRRESVAPNRFIRSGALVKHPSQRYYFWGKPGWLPSVLWSFERATTGVLDVVPLLRQVIDFLDTGERGSNISRE
jgi:hypothetical protein